MARRSQHSIRLFDEYFHTTVPEFIDAVFSGRLTAQLRLASRSALMLWGHRAQRADRSLGLPPLYLPSDIRRVKDTASDHSRFSDEWRHPRISAFKNKEMNLTCSWSTFEVIHGLMPAPPFHPTPPVVPSRVRSAFPKGARKLTCDPGGA